MLTKLRNKLYYMRPSRKAVDTVETIIGTIVVMVLWGIIAGMAFLDLTSK